MAKTKQVRLSVPEDVHAKLKGSAAYAGMTLAQWILQLLAKSVNHKRKG